eukprot:TRINITY_DN1090_c0_g1_i2.p1 TRINITY_DN1090_c0_g1~~TRINITY_DN1090_c0_g1_i2.p1  ORF type:complete len:530 (+),score=134.16 TRINITY_DN1090_c0_g1_i2:191-1780(+)
MKKLSKAWGRRTNRTASADTQLRRASHKLSDLGASDEEEQRLAYVRAHGRKRSTSQPDCVDEEFMRRCDDKRLAHSGGSASCTASPVLSPLGTPNASPRGSARGTVLMSQINNILMRSSEAEAQWSITRSSSLPSDKCPLAEEDDEEAEGGQELLEDDPLQVAVAKWKQHLVICLPNVIADAGVPMEPPKDTTPFEELLGSDRTLVKAMLGFSREMQDLSIATHLTWMITVKKAMASGLVSYCVEKEMSNTRESALLMRDETPYIRTLSTFLDIFGYQFIKGAMPKILKLILASGDIEIDPMREPDDEKRALNRGELEMVINAVLSRIFSWINLVPSDLQGVLASVDAAARRKFPRMNTNVLLGSFFFLRFFNPNLVQPQKYKLLKKELSPADRRKLVLVSKSIQAFVNESQPEGKEQYMEGLINSLLRGRLDDLHVFYRRLLTEKVKKRKSYVQSLDDHKLNAIYFGEHIDPLYMLCRDNLETFLTSVIRTTDEEQQAIDLCQGVLKVFALCMEEPKLKKRGCNDAFL